jgi:helix-turn-helix protein
LSHSKFPPEAATDQRDKPTRGRRCPDGFARVADLIDGAGISRTALYSELKRGRLPAHRWRGRLVVRLVDFQDWLNAAPVPAGAGSPESASDEGGAS